MSKEADKKRHPFECCYKFPIHFRTRSFRTPQKNGNCYNAEDKRQSQPGYYGPDYRADYLFITHVGFPLVPSMGHTLRLECFPTAP